MSTASPSPRAGEKPGAGPPGRLPGAPPKARASTLEITIRAFVSLAVLAIYFATHERIVELLNSLIRSMSGAEPPEKAANVIAVTALGIVLAAAWWKVIKGDMRFHAPILITYILAVGDAKYGILEGHHSDLLSRATGDLVTDYSPTFVAIFVTIAAEMVLSRLLGGQWPHLASAYITGISVGILIKSPDVLPYVLCGAISIVSKYALRIGGRHIWNPSNFGVCLMVYLWQNHQVSALSVQLGNDPWPMYIIWVLGALILWRIGRLNITVTYAIAFLLLGVFRCAYVNDGSVTWNGWLTEIGPITGPPYQLFMFFMITDPKTTTKAKWSQCAVAVLVAIVETVFRLRYREVHAPYYALFIVGPITNLIEIWWYSRHPGTKAKGAPVAPASAASTPALPIEPAPTGGA
jgi:enediyne biosynthesis protein E5